jgi:hypothetical protein
MTSRYKCIYCSQEFTTEEAEDKCAAYYGVIITGFTKCICNICFVERWKKAEPLVTIYDLGEK